MRGMEQYRITKSCPKTFHVLFEGRKEDRPRNGSPLVTTHDQDRYIRNTHQRSRFQTATATAANTHGTHDNRISAQTVRNRLREALARRSYVGCVLARCHCVNRVINLARTHKRWLNPSPYDKF